jgi:hypothetical protein
MGTFHQHKHELHGITVVVDTAGPEIYVGRCDDIVNGKIVLLDGDLHRDGEGGRSKEEFLRRAALYGVWKKFDHVLLDSAQVISIRRLGDL